jgi:hypothetical protein
MVAGSQKLRTLHAFDQRSQSTVVRSQKNENDSETLAETNAQCLLPGSKASFREGRHQDRYN